MSRSAYRRTLTPVERLPHIDDVARRYYGERRGGGTELSGGEQVTARAGARGSVLDAEEAWELLQSGRQAGRLTTEEIAATLGELALDAVQIDEFYGVLEELHIDVVEVEAADGATLDLEGPDVSTDSLQLFLKDIGKVDLLTAPQEVELAKRIERGDQLAKQSMVEANLRLVVEKLNKIARSERKLRGELGREPSAGEIGGDLDLSTAEVEQIRRSAQIPVSLEKPVGDDDESEFGHFLTDESALLPEEAAEQALRSDTLRQILNSLAPREQRILEMRYGLSGEQSRTLDEVGRAFNVTRERIRQIENQCLKKLRAMADCQKLREVA